MQLLHYGNIMQDPMTTCSRGPWHRMVSVAASTLERGKARLNCSGLAQLSLPGVFQHKPPNKIELLFFVRALQQLIVVAPESSVQDSSGAHCSAKTQWRVWRSASSALFHAQLWGSARKATDKQAAYPAVELGDRLGQVRPSGYLTPFDAQASAAALTPLINTVLFA